MMSDRAKKALHFFDADKASRYENRAKRRALWDIEDRMMRDALTGLPPGTSLLDIPVGSGRFLPLYDELEFMVRGMDSSPSMLAIAEEKGTTAQLMPGDILNIDAPPLCYEVSVAIRITHLLGYSDFVAAMSELRRVTRRRIIVSIRLGKERIEDEGVYLREDLAAPGWTSTVKVIHGDWHLATLKRR